MFVGKENIKKPNAGFPGRARQFFQPRLIINQPNDEYGQEADVMADKVMRMPDPSVNNSFFFKPAISSIQRKCAHCEEEEKEAQRKENGSEESVASAQTEEYINSLSGSGRPLNERQRSFFEPRMGYDFSDVKIHTGFDAVKSARSINALAYTTGNNIVFNEGQYAPDTHNGKRLLAHELTHVVQQFHKDIQRQPTPTTHPPSSTHSIPPAPTQGSEYNRGTGFSKERSIPSQDPGSTGPDANTIQVSPGEQLIFNLVGKDKDKKRFAATTPWTEFEGRGPYEIDFAIAGDAELDSAGSGTKTKNIPSLRANNIVVFVQGSWSGRSGITVTATMKDNAPTIPSPDSGNVKDADRIFTWTLVKRNHPCPTSLKIVSGRGNTWTTPPIEFTYQAMPDLPPHGRPDYQGQTVLERFGTASALGFTMTDLEPTYVAANPTLNTPNKVAEAIFTSGDNGTFVFDNIDTITDSHDGFGIVPPYPFKTTAYEDADGVGWNLTQEYVCGGVVIGSYTISRRFTKANGKEIKKT